METETNFELLKDAYAIIDGIPETALAFGPPRSREGASLGDGTVCSPEGWLALHPMFRQRGLAMSPDGTQILLEGDADGDASPAAVMGKVFDLKPEEAQQLFGDRFVFTAGDDSGLSDKILWLQRIRDYLVQKNQIERTPDTAPDTGMLAVQLQERGMASGAASSPP